MGTITKEQSKRLKFYKENDTNTVWWVDNSETVIGERLFTFDKVRIFNLFADYPWKLTKKEREIFDREHPFWADFFKDRK